MSRLEDATRKQLILTGDANVPDLPMTDAQVNHMRRLVAWLRLEPLSAQREVRRLRLQQKTADALATYRERQR